MKSRLLKIRIPTILGIAIIAFAIILTNIVIKNQTNLKSKASDSEKPQNIKITNISDKSFTVTYQTEALITGSVSYGNDKKLGESELDDADKEKGSFSPKKIHSITIKKLLPSTKYYLAIISGSNTFLNNGISFEATTGSDISSSSSAKEAVAKGKVVLPNGNAPSEALVYLITDGSQLLSATAAKDGKFSLSLKDLRTDDLSSYFNASEDTVFKISATDGSLKSAALASFNKIDSVPTITLSNDYDFAQEDAPPASKSAQPSGFPSITPSKNILKPQILNPKENQTFTDTKPQFRGTSLPNEKVEIIINSDETITTQVTADANGNWTYKPSNNLPPGEHTITIKTRDSSGILTTIMQSFTVFAASVPTTIPSITPTQKPVSTSTPIPTFPPSPTVIFMPLPTSTVLPTVNPSPVFLPDESSKGGLPPTGTSPILLLVGGIATAISGITLFLLTHRVL